MKQEELDAAIEKKMSDAGQSQPAIRAFQRAIHSVQSGETGLLEEQSLVPVDSLPGLADLPTAPASDERLNKLAVIKLNGGLGTGMGLDKAKSLIPVKNGGNFLDFLAKQILHLRKQTDGNFPAFHLMNSQSTQRDTLAYLAKYPDLATSQSGLDFLQSRVPKIAPDSLLPVEWPANPELEWCPPGHGDIYPSLLSSGLLDELLDRGIEFIFTSNSDNLGATVDPILLQYFAESKLSFLMEVAERTPSDRKGGHLARRRSDNRLLLRESAQCSEGDIDAFQDVNRHRFFNTNNLWIRLDAIRRALDENDGAFPLPIIRNNKTVDPKDPASPPVLQLESAMGAAIECFQDSGAVVVPRSRFAPVKTTGDLLVLRSDACHVTEDFRIELSPTRQGKPPFVDLDSRHYKLMADFEARFSEGIPSLEFVESLKITGPVAMGSGVVCRGNVEFHNATGECKQVPPGVYENRKVTL